MSVETANQTTHPPGPRSPSRDQRELHPIALGVERIGLLSLSHPWLVAIAAIAFMFAAAFGVTRLKVDDSLSQFFRSNTPEFRQYEEVTRRFPRANSTFWSSSKATTCSRATTSKSCGISSPTCSWSTARAASFRCFRRASRPEDEHLPAPLFPDPLPEGAAYDELIENVMNNEIIRGKLLSEDGKLTLIVLALDPDVARATDCAACRRNPQDGATRSRRLGPSRRAVRRSGHAAGNPQRGRARPAAL